MEHNDNFTHPNMVNGNTIENAFKKVKQDTDDGLYRELSDESIQNDIIFRTYGLNSVVGNSDTDKDYKSPDHRQYIFHTLSNVTDIFAQYPNNMVTHVRKKDKLSESTNIDGRGGKLKIPNYRGVYIIDYYAVTKTNTCGKADLDNMLTYINTSKHIYSNNTDVKDGITRRVNLLEQQTGIVTIRVITFIQENMLKEGASIHVPSSGVTIRRGELDVDMVSPISDVYRKYYKHCYSYITNIIEIDIVDSIKQEDKYFKLNNKVFKLKSSPKGTGADGISIKHYVNKELKYSVTSTLEDCERLGIYKTEEEAECGGNIQLVIDNKKVESELKRAEAELKKLDHEREKREEELKMLKAKYKEEENKREEERRREEEKWRREKEKMEFESIKREEELKMLKEKREEEKEKREEERRRNQERWERELMKERERYDKERLEMLDRHERDMDKLKFEIAGKIVGAIGAIGGLVVALQKFYKDIYIKQNN